MATRLTASDRSKLDYIREEGGLNNDADALRAAIDLTFYTLARYRSQGGTVGGPAGDSPAGD